MECRYGDIGLVSRLGESVLARGGGPRKEKCGSIIFSVPPFLSGAPHILLTNIQLCINWNRKFLKDS